MTPRLAAAILVASLAAAAALPRRRPVAAPVLARPAVDLRRERFLLLFGPMPSTAVH